MFRELDPERHFGRLKLTRSKDGDPLWLCPGHAERYRRTGGPGGVEPTPPPTAADHEHK